MARLASITGETEKENIREEEFSKEENNAQCRIVENDFIAGMLAASAYKTEEVVQIEIVRNGKLFFTFGIHGLGEAVATKSRKIHTKFVKNKQLGIKIAEDVDTTKFRSSLIYHATQEKDRERLWDNKAIWDGLIKQGVQVVTALDVIEAVLLGGEKDKIIDEINKLSGFDTNNVEEVEEKMEDTAKN